MTTCDNLIVIDRCGSIVSAFQPQAARATARETNKTREINDEHLQQHRERDFQGAGQGGGGASAAVGGGSSPGGAGIRADVAGRRRRRAGRACRADKEKLDWRKSIVDLMKLLKLDSSLTARKELAKELHYSGDMNDSASMNIWLHKQVMQKLAENGGKVPEDLKS
jgi:hypothetical protein